MQWQLMLLSGVSVDRVFSSGRHELVILQLVNGRVATVESKNNMRKDFLGKRFGAKIPMFSYYFCNRRAPTPSLF